MDKCKEALDLLLKQDDDGFKFALCMGGFKEDITFENITKWVNQIGEDDWDITILIEDLKSNLSPDTPPQRYIVRDRKTVVVPVLKFGFPNFSTEEAYDGISVNQHMRKINLLGCFLSVMFNTQGEITDLTLNKIRDKTFIANSLEMCRIYSYPFSDEVEKLIEQFCDDKIDENGEVTPPLFWKGLSPHKNKAVFYCTPIVNDNGDLSLSFTISI